MSQSGVYETNVSPGDQPVLGLIGNDAVVVPPNPATGDINIIGASGIVTSGNAGTYTLTITGSSEGSTINGDTGAIAGPDVTIYANQAALNSGATVAFVNSGTVSTLDLSDVNNNTTLGNLSGNLSMAGSYNSALGYSSGSAYSGSESGNILLNSPGVVSENNTLHIGSGTGTGNQQLQSAYISGIDGVNLETANVVVELDDQLGTAVLTAGAGVSITPGANSITIAATGIGSFTWINAVTDYVLAPNTGYVVNFDEEIIFTLPTTAAFGDYYRIAGYSSNGWALNINAGQTIQFGTDVAMSQVASGMPGDCLELLCIIPNTTFEILSSMGNIGIS